MYFLKTIHLIMMRFGRTVSTNLTSLIVILIIFGILPAFVTLAVSSEDKTAYEQLIKVGYLYKFFFFVTWPEVKDSLIEPDDKVVIGIIGKDPFGYHSKDVEGKIIMSMNKQITIKNFGPYREGIDLKQCRILFISSSEKNNIKRIIYNTHGAHILTVADSKGFLEQGVMVNLVNVKKRVRWELNMAAIKKAGLKVSGTLIKSATRVIPTP